MDVELDPLAGPNGGRKSERKAFFWCDQIEKMGKDKGYVNFIKRGHRIEARYRDERNRTEEESRRRYNSLWSNVEILKPAIYGKTPVPLAERKFGDKDPVARGAAQILERALRNEIEICGFHEAMCQAVSDYLLPGRGTLWIRYEPQIKAGVSLPNEDSIDMRDRQGQSTDEDATDGEDLEGVEGVEQAPEESLVQEKLQSTNDEIVRESTPVDYIHWEDFLTFPIQARTWAEVVAVGKRVFLTYEQMRDRFGKEIAKAIPLEKDERQKGRHDSSHQENEVKGEIFEIWSKQDRTVYWVATGYDFLLDRKDDPLTLEGFFPVPRPIIANQTTGTLLPVADYIQYQDQATQIDELSQRIAMLTKACKVVGTYNSAAKGIQRLLNEGVENELIPVDDWSMFAGDKGGVAGQMSFMPLKEVIGVINELMTLKGKQIEEMDRLTGINDLMRGTTDARETLGGQRLKSNNTGTRLTARQNEVARFARDTVKIMADIMAQHFSSQSLVEASGAIYEEGLGIDQDVMQQLQAQQSPALPAPSMGGMAPPPSPMSGAGPGMPPAAAPTTGIPASPPMPPQAGQNVVPFPRPNMAGPGLPVTAPPVAPGLPMPPPPDPMQVAFQQAAQRIETAITLIRDERFRGFRVDIEVDSTIYGDAAQEKGDRTEFISEVTKYLQTSMAMAAQVPEILPLLGKLLQFGVRGFRVGRDLESTIEEFCDSAVKIAKQKQLQAASQPNPEQIKANAQAQQAQATSHAAEVRSQADIAKSQNDIKTAGIEAQSNEQQAQAEVARQQQESAGQQANDQANLVMKQMEVRMRGMEMQIEQMRIVSEKDKNETEAKKAEASIEVAEAHAEAAKEAAKKAAAAPKPASGAA